jgi:hypothetical protein
MIIATIIFVILAAVFTPVGIVKNNMGLFVTGITSRGACNSLFLVIA